MIDEAVRACRDRNPYVGPRPLRCGEALRGREQDARGVTDMLISSRIVLLHSPSGAGKTSLIQASIIPSFEARRFRICVQREPYISSLRINQPPPALPVPNRHAYHTLIAHAPHPPPSPP